MPNVKNVLLLAAVGCALLGCAKPVQKEWFAQGGSKGDGTVQMALTWHPAFEKPQAQQEQAKRIAEEKCRAWGYDDAEPFGGVIKRCIDVQCTQMIAEMNFQCRGGTKPAPAVGKTISK